MKKDANAPAFTQIGQITQPQGINGELKVVFFGDDIELIEKLSLVYLQNYRGDFIPARIENLRIQIKSNNYLFFVQFDHIADRSSAEELRNNPIFLETDEAVQFVNTDDESVIHYDVFTNDNKFYGTVIDVLEGTAQDVLIIAKDTGKILVPMVDFYILEIDDEQQAIYCTNLELLED